MNLIGVDGGASGVRVYRIAPENFSILESCEELYAGRDWVEVCAELLRGFIQGPTVVGFAMPGVKTSDRRGIERLNHAAPCSDFLDRLAEQLPADTHLGPLGSDGELAALGETVPPGKLVGVRSGYYLGGGTGVSEGLLTDGVAGPIAPRAWELGWESRLAPSAWNAAFRAEKSRDPRPSLEEEALRGDPLANQILLQAARDMTEFLQLRGLEVERIVLGQRYGRLLEEPFSRLFPVQSKIELVGSQHRAAPAVGAAMRACSDFQTLFSPLS